MSIPSYKKYFDLDKIIAQIKQYLPELDVEKFKEAFNFAEEAHRGQMRKDGTTPYIVHPVRALEILINLKADEDTLISTLLHDVPEDTEKTIEDVEDHFGKRVAFLVNGITKLSKVQYQQNMSDRQVESLKKLLLHSAEDLRVIVIKLADRLHNMQTLENVPKPEKRIRIATETLEIYVPIANLLGIRELKFQLEDQCFKHLFPTEYSQLKEKIERGTKERMLNLKKFMQKLEKIALEEGMEIRIYERQKNIYSIYKKLCALGRAVEDLDNRIAVNVVVKDLASCYQVLGLIHTNFVPKPDRFKDYIANPKVNGYRSIHTTVFGVDGNLTELQIRSENMDLEAEYGIVAGFFLEKGKEGVQSYSAGGSKSSWLKKIIDFEQSQGTSANFIDDLKSDFFEERIFVFTPKGDVVDLPKGSSVVDFAYAIHSEIGNKTAGAYINGKSRPISEVLKTGDLVDVKTNEKVEPDLSWISIAKTNQAKKGIHAFIKKESREKRLKHGRKILQREFDIAGLGLVDSRYFRKNQKALELRLKRHFKNLNELLLAVAHGDVGAREVVNLKNSQKPRRGSLKKQGKERVVIKVAATNRFGLMQDIGKTFYDNAEDMYSFKGWTSKHDSEAYYTADMLVSDLSKVGEIIDQLQQIDAVKVAYHFSRKGIASITLLTIFLTLAWVGHPFVLSHVLELQASGNSSLLINFLLYGGLLTLLASVWAWGYIIKQYFPLFRTKKLLWTTNYVIPILAILTLVFEVMIYDLNLSWVVLAIEFLMIYGYLAISYYSYRQTFGDY